MSNACNSRDAYAIFKLIDYDDWQTTVEIFNKIPEIWWKLTVSRFANNENTKTKINSNYWCAGTIDVNVCTVSWSGNHYIVNIRNPSIYSAHETTSL